MAARRFTDTEEREIEKVYRAGGFSSTAIAEQYHCARHTVRDAIRRAGGEMRTLKVACSLSLRKHGGGKQWRFTEAEGREIEKIYRVGEFNAPVIAKQYHCSLRAIHNTIKRVGGQLRSSKEANALYLAKRKQNPLRLFTDAEEREIEKVYRVGKFSAPAIAEQYPCGVGVIRSAIKRAGGKSRTSRDAAALCFPSLIRFDGPGYPIITITKLRGVARSMAEKIVNARAIVRVHRLVMALHLHRPLLPAEIVHHRDGNKANYHTSNLELLTTKMHTTGWGNPYYQAWQEALAENRKLRAKIEALGRNSNVSI